MRNFRKKKNGSKAAATAKKKSGSTTMEAAVIRSRKQRADKQRESAPAPAAADREKEGRSAKEAAAPTADERENSGVNMQTSGKLLEDTNVINGVTVKYAEPPEARKPRIKWRLYVFKGDEELPILYIHRQSAYLMGRDRKVADIPLDHPSCSKQHAVLQYRLVDYTVIIPF